MLKIKILKPSKAELLRQYQQLYDESTIVEVEFNSLKQEVLNRQVFIMADDEEYCLRLEKIIDKQDGLLNHYDAKFNQQNSLNDALSRQNKILKEDLQKHKNLLKDMKKNIDQHKNVVNKLKKELEEQLKIQQNLHKDYGEVIKELTDELELQEKQKEEIQNKTKQIGNNQPINNNSKLKSNRVELPPREHDNDHVADAKDLFNNVKEKSKEAIDEISENHKKNTATSTINNNVPKTNENKCPKCGSVVDNSFIFCDKCGYKLK